MADATAATRMSAAALVMLALASTMWACDASRPNGEPCLKASDCDSSFCRGGICVAEPVNTPATSSNGSGPSSSSGGGMGGMGGSAMGGMGGAAMGGMGGAAMGGMGGAGGSGGT